MSNAKNTNGSAMPNAEQKGFEMETVKVIAQSLPSGLNLSDAGAAALSRDAEYRIREIVQDSIKFMRHAKRSSLSTDDVNAALRLRNIQQIHGFGGDTTYVEGRGGKTSLASYGASHGTNTRDGVSGLFSQVDIMPDVFFVEDHELSVQSQATKPPPPIPLDTTVSMHWLAVDGTQPATNQNPAPDRNEEVDEPVADNTARLHTPVNNVRDVEVRPVVRHDLSRELHLFFEQVSTAVSGFDESHLQACLSSIATMQGLNQVLPYISQFIYNTVTKNAKDLRLLFSCMRLARAIASNPNLNLDAILKQLLPAVVTCVVGKRLCTDPREIHWSLRDFSVRVVQQLVANYNEKYPSIRPRFIKTLSGAISDHKKPLTTHYGCIMGMGTVGSKSSRQLLGRQLSALAPKLERFLSKAERNSIRRLEGLKVVGAIVWTCTQAQNADSVSDAGDMIDTLEDSIPEVLRGYIDEAKTVLGNRFEPHNDFVDEKTMAEAIRKRLHVSLSGTPNDASGVHGDS